MLTMRNNNSVYTQEQQTAANKLSSGNILLGGVGVGKSRTAILNYWYKNRGKPLLILTTAKKRNTGEWLEEFEALQFPMPSVAIDSWNNIKKYSDFKEGHVIFDEQRLVGNGTWVKTFYKIAKKNYWVLLSATPGDVWLDYIPVLVANGLYKNRNDFINKHVVYKKFVSFPMIDRYIDQDIIQKNIDKIVVVMVGQTKKHRNYHKIELEYDVMEYRRIMKERTADGVPLVNASKLVYELRKTCNIHTTRDSFLLLLIKKIKRIVLFYNYRYELEHLVKMLKYWGITYAEYNGRTHDHIPTTDSWVYLVQYRAGCEGWNCTTTDSMILYSLNYSYKCMEQSYGRIDRLSSNFSELHYYTFITDSPVDKRIEQCVKTKKLFTERKFVETGM